MNRKLIASSSSFVVSLAVAFALGGCGGAASSGPRPDGAWMAHTAALDGTAYDVTLSFPDEAPVKDTLRFEGGRFESTACTVLGFPEWSDYHADARTDAIVFAADARHPDGTTMDWRGMVKDGAMEGTALRTLGGRQATGTVHGVRR